MRAFREPVFGQHDGRALEAVRFDDVRAGLEICAMNIANHVRTRDREHFIAAFVLRAAEVRRGETAILDHGAHGAIHHQNAFIECGQQFPSA